jgi:chromosome segregation ATPase
VSGKDEERERRLRSACEADEREADRDGHTTPAITQAMRWLLDQLTEARATIARLEKQNDTLDSWNATLKAENERIKEQLTTLASSAVGDKYVKGSDILQALKTGEKG